MIRCIAIRAGLTVSIMVALSGSVFAQATRPSMTWPDAVTQLAEAVRGKDLAAISSVLDRAAMIRGFASEMVQPPERLLGAATGARLLGAHAYSKTPATLATDLATDFQNAAGLPEPMREHMTPPDEAAAKRANETAAQWLTQVLRAAKDQPVGVIVLWREDRTDSFSSLPNRPLFILVKGQLVDGQYLFRQVIFGDPLEAAR